MVTVVESGNKFLPLTLHKKLQIWRSVLSVLWQALKLLLLTVYDLIEPFSIDYRKNKTKATTMANQKVGKYLSEITRSQSKKTTKLSKVSENAGDKVVIGFSFTP